MLEQLVSVAGALMILAAYAAYQRGRLGREDVSYNLLNVVGSGLLTWVAVVDRRWGFIMLEGIWALLSVPPLVAAWRSRRGPG
ncbi:MAG TPA: hypothetical protein VFS08_05290 [Gemmatimonadaceae bacterium]|nr:hypothetical protein [Gemmatimonadaceae bacterium]